MTLSRNTCFTVSVQSTTSNWLQYENFALAVYEAYTEVLCPLCIGCLVIPYKEDFLCPKVKKSR